VQEYVDAVQMRIEMCEAKVTKYSTELMIDTDGVKEYTRKYVGEHFENSD